MADILAQAGVSSLPQARVGVLVGNRFDPRGGEGGTPRRQTPWGELAWQLGGEAGYRLMASFDQDGTAPGGDTLARLFELVGQPILLLLDEVLGYASRHRGTRLGGQFYHFLQALTEEARGHRDVVVAVATPVSEVEMSTDDQADYTRLEKMLNRLAKPLLLAAEGETAEIIRRRLFDWTGLPDEGKRVAAEYGAWALAHRAELPRWFPVDHARATFEASYPFHPTTLSVFERKWQSLPSFQRTRGVLRMLATWVMHAYEEGYRRVNGDPLLTLGSAPLDDPLFRTIVIGQVGEQRLEGVIATDIAGRAEAHARRLDETAGETIRRARVHRQVATAIFFESNGGHLSADATVPELRLAVAGPQLETGHIETAAELLRASCYYLRAEGTHYRFALTPNLNKILADREANIQREAIRERAQQEIQRAFAPTPRLERRFFPEEPGDIPNQAVLVLVVMAPHHALSEPTTRPLIEAMIQGMGASKRTYKSALLFAVADNIAPLNEAARRLLALEAIQEEERQVLDDAQRGQLREDISRAQRDLRERVWRSYKNILLLDRDNSLRQVDLGMLNSSAAESLTSYYLRRLETDGDVTDKVSANFLIRHWPPAFQEWSTQQVRDMFFASPLFPRLLDGQQIKETIAAGVDSGVLAYVGRRGDGYEPFHFGEELSAAEVELSQEMFILKGEVAEAYLRRRAGAELPVPGEEGAREEAGDEGVRPTGNEGARPDPWAGEPPAPTRLSWEGQVAPQKWSNFYIRVLSRFAVGFTLTLRVHVEVSERAGIPRQKIEEMRLALRELGLSDEVESE